MIYYHWELWRIATFLRLFLIIATSLCGAWKADHFDTEGGGGGNNKSHCTLNWLCNLAVFAGLYYRIRQSKRIPAQGKPFPSSRVVWIRHKVFGETETTVKSQCDRVVTWPHEAFSHSKTQRPWISLTSNWMLDPLWRPLKTSIITQMRWGSWHLWQCRGHNVKGIDSHRRPSVANWTPLYSPPRFVMMGSALFFNGFISWHVPHPYTHA